MESVISYHLLKQFAEDVEFLNEFLTLIFNSSLIARGMEVCVLCLRLADTTLTGARNCKRKIG